MPNNPFRLDFPGCRALLRRRLREPAPGRIQMLAGPRQVGKTTLLLELFDDAPGETVYLAADAPEAALPGFWERAVAGAEQIAQRRGRAVLMVDEAHLLHDWARRLKGTYDHLRRKRIPVHLVATGSSALHLATGSRESLAGRFERLTMSHWSARALATAFELEGSAAAELLVRLGSYPGAFALRNDAPRWSAYLRDSIVEPAVGRDLLALAQVRRPALLRQVFAVAATSPAQIVSLQKLQGQLQDRGALETVAHYLALLEEAFLVAPLQKFSPRAYRQRAAPPKLVTLNNALLAVADSRGAPDQTADPARFGAWVENACLAHAWNAGQEVRYWREEPLEVDGVLTGSWGSFAVEVKTGKLEPRDLIGLLELTRRHRELRPLVICTEETQRVAARLGVASVSWREFLLSGPPVG